MDLEKHGQLLRLLRKSKNLTQKDLENAKFEIILLNSFAYKFMDKYSEFNYIAPTKVNKVSFCKKG